MIWGVKKPQYDFCVRRFNVRILTHLFFYFENFILLLNIFILCVWSKQVSNNSFFTLLILLIFFLSLLFICRELHDGTSIKENGIMDGSKIILLPNVETGLLVNIYTFCYLLLILYYLDVELGVFRSSNKIRRTPRLAVELIR